MYPNGNLRETLARLLGGGGQQQLPWMAGGRLAAHPVRPMWGNQPGMQQPPVNPGGGQLQAGPPRMPHPQFPARRPYQPMGGPAPIDPQRLA